MNESRHHTELNYSTLAGDNISTMQAYFNDALVCMYSNAAFAAWWGKLPEHIEGRGKLSDILAGEYKYIEQHVTGVLAGKPQNFEFSRAARSGFGMLYTCIKFVPHTVFGKTKGFIIEAEDVTATKQKEEEVRANHEVVVKQNDRLLNFANIVTHNLMNYAGSLEATLELYRSAAGETEKQELFSLLEDISTSLAKTLKTLNEVVKVPNMARIPMERVNLYHYVIKATEALRPQFNATDAVIKNNVSRNVYVEAIPAYMESIVYNFLSNTIKYRHNDRRPEIELNSLIVGNEAVLSIRDNGIGIDLQTNRSKLYGLYQTFGDNADASGIGLFITKYQVDSMGGYIGVESEIGKGTEFRVYFKKKG